jgi:tetratricopeptide (TPR) repeat protein
VVPDERPDPIAYERAYNSIGQILLTQNEPTKALAAFSDAILYGNHSTPAIDNYAKTLLLLGDATRARKEFEACLKVHSTSCDCLAGLASTSLAVGNYDTAVEEAQVALRRCDGNSVAYGDLCVAYLKKRLCADSVDACGVALEIDPECGTCRRALVEAKECADGALDAPSP